ncbi:hypothetical protein TNIN_244451 [Trichonephila inaurata madagascariensis]|uniref:Uncharacterized protein n=1 Tax=Trichonephila inaurata madagascariensis TaxID=2747483 RepID=A0A8X6WQH0_9ARAC|nr:hypothetical protein TNIN_244451 [Trichonephila inaurata madagascariensis]
MPHRVAEKPLPPLCRDKGSLENFPSGEKKHLRPSVTGGPFQTAMIVGDKIAKVNVAGRIVCLSRRRMTLWSLRTGLDFQPLNKRGFTPETIISGVNDRTLSKKN